MRDQKVCQKTLLFTLASTLAQACFLKLVQQKTASASHKSSFRNPNIAQK
jgi:hypothetical protein